MASDAVTKPVITCSPKCYQECMEFTIEDSGKGYNWEFGAVLGLIFWIFVFIFVYIVIFGDKK